MAMFVVLVQIAHLPMVSMLMTFIKGISWATVGFFQLYRRWLEYQAGIHEFAVIAGPYKIFPWSLGSLITGDDHQKAKEHTIERVVQKHFNCSQNARKAGVFRFKVRTRRYEHL